MSETIEMSVLDKLRNYIDSNGIKLSWIAEKMNRHISWPGKVLNGTIPITPELLQKFEELLKTKF